MTANTPSASQARVALQAYEQGAATAVKGVDERGRLRPGIWDNSDAAEGLRYTCSIFAAAQEQKLDVYAVCGTLRADIRDHFYRDLNGKSFVDSVRDVLRAGANVNIFIWSNRQSDLDVSAFSGLPAERDDTWGQLVIEACHAEREEDRRRIAHFVLATNYDDVWISRIEQPHPDLTDEEVLKRQINVPATIFNDKRHAAEQGKRLLDIYRKMTMSEAIAAP